MRYCYVACLSRGGSNLLAALMHNNPVVYAVAKRDWRRFYKSKVLTPGILGHVAKTKKSIYFRGGFYKNLDDINVFMLDKFLEKGFGFKIPPHDNVVGLIRNPFAIINSMNRYGHKYKFKQWCMTPAKVYRVINNRFVSLIRYCNSHQNAKLFWFNDIVTDTNAVINEVSVFLGIEPHTHISFSKTFNDNGCVHCGGEFSTVMSDCADASNVLLERGMKYRPSNHFYCPKCKLLTLGYGSFNPCKEIKQPEGWSQIPDNLRKAVRSVLIKEFGKKIATRFEKNNITKEIIRGL